MHYKIAVGTGAGPASEFLTWKQRRMGAGQRKIQEKRLVPGGGFADISFGLSSQVVERFFNAKTGRGLPFSPETPFVVVGFWHGHDLRIRTPSVFEIHVRRHVQRGG